MPTSEHPTALRWCGRSFFRPVGQGDLLTETSVAAARCSSWSCGLATSHSVSGSVSEAVDADRRLQWLTENAEKATIVTSFGALPLFGAVWYAPSLKYSGTPLHVGPVLNDCVIPLTVAVRTPAS